MWLCQDTYCVYVLYVVFDQVRMATSSDQRLFASRLHWNFQLFHCVFDGFFKLSIFRINEIEALSTCEHCRASTSRLPILASLYSERLFPIVDHIFSFGRFFLQKSELRESFPRIWQMVIRVDIPIIISTLFLQHVQISMRRPSNINVLQWNRDWFFLRHVELNSRFSVMTTDEVTLKRPEVGTGFRVTCWSCQLRPSRFALNFSTKILTPYILFLSWSGFSEFVVSSWQFCCTICYWECKLFSPPLWRQHFFRSDSSRMDFRCVHLFQFLNICNQNISFPNVTRG